MSLFEGEDASLLPVKVDGFTHPGFECIRDFFH